MRILGERIIFLTLKYSSFEYFYLENGHFSLYIYIYLFIYCEEIIAWDPYHKMPIICQVSGAEILFFLLISEVCPKLEIYSNFYFQILLFATTLRIIICYCFLSKNYTLFD